MLQPSLPLIDNLSGGQVSIEPLSESRRLDWARCPGSLLIMAFFGTEIDAGTKQTLLATCRLIQTNPVIVEIVTK